MSTFQEKFIELRKAMGDGTSDCIDTIEKIDLNQLDANQVVAASRDLFDKFFDIDRINKSLDGDPDKYLKELRKRLLILGSIIGFCCDPNQLPPALHWFAIELGKLNDSEISADYFRTVFAIFENTNLNYEISVVDIGELNLRIKTHVYFIEALSDLLILDHESFHFLRKKIRDIKNFLQMVYLGQPSNNLLGILVFFEQLSQEMGEVRESWDKDNGGYYEVEIKMRERIRRIKSIVTQLFSL